MVVDEWTFGLVTQQTSFTSAFDAIIGLAYREFAEDGVTPIMDALMDAKVLAENLFSFNLSMNPDEESELRFGEIIEDASDNNFTWHDVRHKLFWSLQLDDVLVNGESTGYCQKEGKNCLITPDSGTSALTMPKHAYEEFSKQYGDTVDCSDDDILNFGKLTYVIDGKSYDVPSHHWVKRTVDHSKEGDGSCKMHISQLDVSYDGLTDLFIVGDAFMQLFYTVFDRENDKVGFAHAKHKLDEIHMEYDTLGNLATVSELEAKAAQKSHHLW